MRILCFPSVDFDKAFHAAVKVREEFSVRVALGNPTWRAVNNTLPILVTNSETGWKPSIRRIADFWRLRSLYIMIVHAKLSNGYVVSAKENGDIVLHFMPHKSPSA